ncbi:class B sortase [Porcincola intestinalis]|nr:class B sortase [Porcincola intestinalis]
MRRRQAAAMGIMLLILIAVLIGLIVLMKKDKLRGTWELDQVTVYEFDGKGHGALLLPQYAPLYEQNSDFFGWITIEGTDIDYPVMYSPDRPEYYLNRAFDGSYSGSGVPSIDGKCPPDGKYYLIYGHHMKNKTMFGSLPKYADKSYYEDHPIIRFDTLYEQREYQVIAAFYSRIYDKKDAGVFCYYEYTDLSDQEVFDEHIRQVKAAAIYDTGLSAEYGDELLALSTCNYHTQDGRFVVVAKRIATLR